MRQSTPDWGRNRKALTKRRRYLMIRSLTLVPLISFPICLIHLHSIPCQDIRNSLHVRTVYHRLELGPHQPLFEGREGIIVSTDTEKWFYPDCPARFYEDGLTREWHIDQGMVIWVDFVENSKVLGDLHSRNSEIPGNIGVVFGQDIYYRWLCSQEAFEQLRRQRNSPQSMAWRTLPSTKRHDEDWYLGVLPSSTPVIHLSQLSWSTGSYFR